MRLFISHLIVLFNILPKVQWVDIFVHLLTLNFCYLFKITIVRFQISGCNISLTYWSRKTHERNRALGSMLLVWTRGGVAEVTKWIGRELISRVIVEKFRNDHRKREAVMIIEGRQLWHGKVGPKETRFASLELFWGTLKQTAKSVCTWWVECYIYLY